MIINIKMRGVPVRYLLDEEYKKRRSEFLSAHKKTISDMVLKEKEKFLNEREQHETFRKFVNKYCGGLVIPFIIVFLAWANNVINFWGLVGFVLLEVFVFSGVYSGWKSDYKQVSIEIFINKSHGIIQQYIWNKMLVELNSEISEEEYEMAVQFYSIAMYDIPRNASIVDINELIKYR